MAEGDRDHFDIDHGGALVDRGELDVHGPAILIAVPVTDAVKVVYEGQVRGSLDRGTLWSIEGFRLEREVLLALDIETIDPEGLVDAVVAAGFQWQVINPKTGVL